MVMTAPNGNATMTEASKREGKVTDKVLAQVEKLRSSGAITLPADYNVGNALNSAWLKLQTVADKDQRLIIQGGQVNQQVVTLTSVANALHDYVIQGLNCAKNQAYFIVYGNVLTCQRSYFGDILVAQRARPGIKPYFDSIREGEVFTVVKKWSDDGLTTVIGKHEVPFPRNSKIVGAYCGFAGEDGEDIGVTVMDIDRIKRSWAKSKTYKWSKPDKPTTHDEFPEEMALRTVIRKHCKPIINSSNDELLVQAMLRQDLDHVEGEVADEAAQFANQETLALPSANPEIMDPESGEGSQGFTDEEKQRIIDQESKGPKPGF